jgi:pimeloyl-ACP methyl ester carboxylesterase
MVRYDIFKNARAKQRQEEWYQYFLMRAGYKTEVYTVPTSLGYSHILTAGSPVHPPAVCLHAMLTGSAHLLSEIRELAESYYVIAPDIPGHSVKGLSHRLSFKDNSHAEWLKEVTDGLGLGHFDLFGVSLGGFIARQFASSWPEKVNHLALLVPAGIVQPLIVQGMIEMALPMAKYRLKPTEENLKELAGYLLHNWDEDWGHFIGDALHDFFSTYELSKSRERGSSYGVESANAYNGSR